MAGAVFRRIRKAERQVIPQVDGIVYVSRWARDALLGWLPEAAAVPSEVIFNFVDPADCAPSTPEPARDLVTVGSLVLVKNHSFLLDVLAETKKSGQVLTLDIFGEGPLRSDLEQRISSLGLDDQVRLRGFRSDVRTLFQAIGPTSTVRTPSRSVWRSSRRWRPAFPSWQETSGQFQSSSTTASKGGIGLSTIRSRRRRKLMDLLGSEPERLRAARSATERFHRDFDADIVASRLFRFVMGITPPASNQAATKPLAL